MAVLACLSGLSLPAAADNVVADDEIVQGSLCVGIDCVNNENFGFDTIRLKENNLRIDFEDTSSSAGFPSNDWGIVVNDSPSGGANYFMIEDRGTDGTSASSVFRIDAGANGAITWAMVPPPRVRRLFRWARPATNAASPTWPTPFPAATRSTLRR
ncbi:hypothetical protein H1235_04890 [Pseudoxanthomonas sp. NC8]|nr:hypothetical protein H1235_04890 [Pseudoxanthomonas sp. NC8]